MVRKIRNRSFFSLTFYSPFVIRNSSFVIFLFALLLCPLHSISQSGEKNEIAPSGNPALCWYTATADSFTYGYLGQNIIDYHVDVSGNTYTAGYMFSGFYGWNVWNMVIQKFDKNGNLEWRKFHDAQNLYNYNDTYRSTFCTAITTDTSGNIYITGNYGCRRLILDNITFTGTNNYQKGFIAKLDFSGNTLWAINYFHPNATVGYSAGGSDIKYLSDDRIYVFLYGSGTLYHSDGSTQILGNSYNLIQIDKDGHFRKSKDLTYGGNGALVGYFNPDNSSWNSNMVASVSPKITFSHKKDKLFLVGTFRTRLYLTYPTLYIDSISTGVNGFVAIADTSLTWKKGFTTYGTTATYSNGSGQTWPDIFPSFTTDTNDCVYVAARWDSVPGWPWQNTMEIIQGQPLMTVKGSFIAKYDTSGNVKWYNHNPLLFTRSLSRSASNDILVFGEFDDSVSFVSQIASPVKVVASGKKDMFLGSLSKTGNMNWVRNLGSPGMDYSWFMKSHPCSDNMYFTGRLETSGLFMGSFLNNAGHRIFASKFSENGNCIDTTCVTHASGAGIEDYGQQMWIHCFPNPSSGIITIASTEKISSLEIFNLLGKRVYYVNIPHLTSYRINLDKQPGGIYFYKAKMKSQRIHTGKIIIE